MTVVASARDGLRQNRPDPSRTERRLEIEHICDSRKFVSRTRVSGDRAGLADVRGRSVSVVRFCVGCPLIGRLLGSGGWARPVSRDSVENDDMLTASGDCDKRFGELAGPGKQNIGKHPIPLGLPLP